MLTLAISAVNRNDCESLYESNGVIEFRNVESRISSNASRLIRSGVSLEIHQGETIALLGRSGSGKTTMLKLINRLRTCTSGTILVDRRSVREWDPIRLRRRIGYVIQEVGLFPHLTVEENVSLVPGLEERPATRIKQRYAHIMHLLRIK